jgi:parvulin-like peptidyl-prolyl isomerase
MRLALVIMLSLLLTACAPSLEGQLRERADVRLFLAMVPDATYAQSAFSGEQATAVASLVAAECPSVAGAFTRAVFSGSGANLIAYASSDGAVACVLFQPGEGNVTQRPQGEAPEGVVMTVNGEPVLRSDVNARLDALPQDTPRDEAALGAVLNALAGDALLRQQARDVQVSDEDRARVRTALLAQLGSTEEQLPAALAQQGVSQAQFDDAVRAQAQLEGLVRSRLLGDEINISEEGLRDLYLRDPNQFLQGEQATMRHILISSAQRTGEQARERALLVAGQLNTTDFCDLVRAYSDDPSRKDRCGTFVITRGVVDPTLEAASFGTPAGQTAIVETNAGIHLVQTLQVSPAQVIPYDQVEPQLRSLLVNRELQGRLALYLAALRGRSDIVIYLP